MTEGQLQTVATSRSNLALSRSRPTGQRRVKASRWGRSHLAACLLTVSTLLLPAPVRAAERIQFFIGPFEPTIYVADLEQFAATGQINRRFAPVASRLSASQLNELRSALNWRFNLNQTTIGELAYSPVGVRLLRRLGQVVQTDNRLNGFSALRASLILAAADSEGLTVVNILRQFPLRTIQLNYPLLQQLIQENRQFFQARDRTVAALRAAALQDTTALPNNPALDPRQPGPLTWEKRSLPLENPLRLFSSTADVYLPTLPANAADIPVVVISHGAASRRTTFAYLAEHLASHGYAVVALDHEDNADRFERFLLGIDGAPNPAILINRPRDVTAALDALEALAETDPLIRRLNLTQVGIIGQSLGGYTALAVAGATLNPEALAASCPSPVQESLSLNLSMLVQCDLLDAQIELPTSLRDERVSSAIAINPLTSHIFGETGLNQVQIPVMVVASTHDYLTPALPEQIEPFAWLSSPDKHLVVVEQGTHFSFLGGNTGGGALPLPAGFQGPSVSAAHPYLQALSLAFFNRYSLNQPEAEAYLSQPYLETFDQSPLRVTIVRDLP
ncbi:MAG: alpha/beta hydrolase [Cyanobacteria bacterium Co-bin13]|nr:alpha/beta hydrolase [Cyanobacteria bacterium Co-bin13]